MSRQISFQPALSFPTQIMITKLTSGFWRNLYYLRYIPSLWFWNVVVLKVSHQESEVMIRHRWSNKNPFKSIYFSALAGAAELSTGLLALMACQKNNTSMLVTGMEARFFKKATGKIIFKCLDGDLLNKAVQNAIDSGEGREIMVVSIGYNEDGVMVAQFKYTWSFRQRKSG